MAMYEKGGADFAQEQFAKARDYREEQAKNCLLYTSPSPRD